MWGPSLVELLSRPEIYHGRRVRVIGFVNFAFEGNALYLSRADWENGVRRNGLWIDPPPQLDSSSGTARAEPNRRYVLVERHSGQIAKGTSDYGVVRSSR